ncbi:hypothetical protein OJF2_35150 [Aquisphaera giovannonii]|uniref:Addiction module component n=1 Tax=Aquisphaera giovannonii TaxID=406548 RepID=A0A5B9W4P2_9BACT|nr:hypothetical protein [Aquisphaera giovannonii]QEH34970.1 hypothetical protein OJF2_35150 [Aquisphaera giovannonii]
MATERLNDSRAFRDFLDARLAKDGGYIPLDEALGLWEYENQTDDERAKTLAVIRQGLADAEAGRLRPLEEFDRDFRAKRGLPPRP